MYSTEKNKPNKLINEKSPYLLQHANNPVDWYPWGKEAFDKAREEDKPIFLSIGYSTCHWCHVMEHESFEDEEVANLMNKTFVSIKVDREERPDIDSIYMSVCQMITGGGGWPLTIIMTPEQEPFFAGTYYPKETSYGRLGMIDLVQRVQELWASDRLNIQQSTESIVNHLKSIYQSGSKKELNKEIFEHTYEILENNFDSENGGFGSAPKFPSVHNLLFLLRYWKQSGNKKALEMVTKTLTKMQRGGLYDHLKYGFARYSTDTKWVVPHFEKMLYDQAMLVIAYLEAYQATKVPEFLEVAEETLIYVMRDMTHPDGGFYSAEDADSEGEEGKFIIWRKEEIIKILGKADAKIFNKVFDVTEGGNFIESFHKSAGGKNILYMKESLEHYADELDIDKKTLKDKLASMKKKLYEERKKRVQPHKDDKILTDWNGLMIAAFARAYSITGEKKYLDTATRATEFIKEKLTDKDKNLLHRFRDGESGIYANLDDYAFFGWGLSELYEATYNIKYLRELIEIMNISNVLFFDSENGGYFFTSGKNDGLLTRTKELYDGAIPAGSSIILMLLIKLHYITGDEKYKKYIDDSIKAAGAKIERAPNGFTMFLAALDHYLNKSYEIVISSDGTKENIELLNKTIKEKYIPNKVLLYKDSDIEVQMNEIAPYLKNYKPINNKATVYVCSNFSCNTPVTDPEELDAQLD